MNQQHGYPAELFELLDVLREHSELSPEQLSRFRELLRESEAARRVYVQYMELCAGLRWMCESRQVAPVSAVPDVGMSSSSCEDDAALLREVLEEEQRAAVRRAAQRKLEEQLRAEQEAQRRVAHACLLPQQADLRPVRHIVIPRAVVYAAIGAVAAMVVLMIHMWMRPPVQPSMAPEAIVSTPSHAATLTEVMDTVWSDPMVPVNAGAKLKPGRLHLLKGLARVTFANGAEVILEAPCEFEVLDGERGYLRNGRIAATVPPRGKGFSVQTPGHHVVDLGTSFGMNYIDATQTLEVHVFQGLVEANVIDENGASRRSQKLRGAEAARFRGDEVETLAANPSLFVRELNPIALKLASAYSREVLADRPLAYWPLNDAAGSRTVLDLSGNNFHGTLHGEVKLGEPGPFGSRSTAAFIHRDGRIDIGYEPSFRFTSHFTIEAWIRVDDLKARGGWMVSGYTVGPNRGWGMGYNAPDDTRITAHHPGVRGAVFSKADYAFPRVDPLIEQGKWAHWVFTVDGNHVGRFYLNGRLVQTVQGSGPGVEDRYHVTIGNMAHTTSSAWSGGIAEVAIYTRPLSEERIRAHFEASRQ